MIGLQTALDSLGWTLLHFLWQGLMIAAALGVARRGLRDSSPRMRYAVACLALAAAAAVPLATWAILWNAAVPISVSGAPAPLLARGVGGHPAQPMTWLLVVWGLGVATLAMRLGVGWGRLWRLVRRETSALEDPWPRRVEQLVERIGLKTRQVRIRVSEVVACPAVIGCWRPVILLPVSAFTGLPVAQLEAVILHELAHVRRWDPWVHRVQLVLETLLFYHPAVWWISRVVHEEREYCCDAMVVALTGDRIDYARALTRVESMRGHVPQHGLASTGGSLMNRIRHIVQPTSLTTRSPWSMAACGLAALGLVVLLLAGTSAIGESPDGSARIAWMPDSVARWNAELEKAADDHGVDPALLEIVTLVESRGNPNAQSPLGATGLMQVMPATAKRIAEVRGLDDFDLSDPATNLDFGAWYMARQIDEFGDGTLSQDTVLRAAAAYNGGPKRMQAHLEKGEPLTDESRSYSRLVSELWQEREMQASPAFGRWSSRWARSAAD